MAQFKITEARLLQIKHRQWEDRWGANYIAAIFADPIEAPGISTGTILRPLKVGEREFHTLSTNETFAALLALHHPNCWEVHEQRILPPTPRTHYLFGHTRASGLSFKHFEGTLDVADRLGMLSQHPRVRLKIGNDPRKWPMAPFPYLSDLLLYLDDAVGPYVLNWPIKDKYEDFRRRGPGNKRDRPDQDDPAAVARNLLEETCFLDANIRTHRIAGKAIDFEVRCNLRDLFLDDTFPTTIDEIRRAEIYAVFREAIGVDSPAHVIARKAAKDFRISDREAVALIKQGIWRRELRVDLFQPVRLDKPLRPEVEDVFVRYGEWFHR